MRSRRPPVLLVIFLVLAAVVLYQHRHGVAARVRAALNIRPPAGRSVLEAGQPLPAVSLTDLAGETKSLAPRPGHVLYLNVFATWCPDCREETPALEQLRKATASMPVDVVGVDQEEDLEPVSQFAQQYGLTYPIYLDRDGLTHALMGVRFIPTSFIVDSHGIVRARITGALTLAQMQSAVSAVLHGRSVTSN